MLKKAEVVCMVKVYEGKEYEFYMDGYLQANLDMAKKVIKQDWDMIFLIDGAERSGKSVFAQQCAKYCDESFDEKRIVFTPDEFKNAVIKAGKYQAVVYDEAYRGLSSRSALSSINKTIVSMLSEIGQKNLFIFIVMPSFFDLDRYVAIWRSRALIHVYTKRFERGYFQFYDYEKKKIIYMAGKKTYNYSVAKPNFIGRFTNVYAVDEQKYRKKKAKSLKDYELKLMGADAMTKDQQKRVGIEFMRRYIINKYLEWSWTKKRTYSPIVRELLDLGEVNFRRLVTIYNKEKSKG